METSDFKAHSGLNELPNKIFVCFFLYIQVSSNRGDVLDVVYTHTSQSWSHFSCLYVYAEITISFHNNT